MKYVVKYGDQYLRNWDDYWTSWTTDPVQATVFATLEEAVRVAGLVHGEAVPR